MERIREANLEAVVKRINKVTGSPTEPYSRTKSGGFKPNIGSYLLDFACGAVSLVRMAEGGGTHEILPRGTKRELYGALCAFLAGLSERTKQ